MTEGGYRWCHVTVTTYGNWLPGDPRGFRTWDHREHVQGDYKQPPQEDYRARHHHARQSQTQAAVLLTPDQQRAVTLALRERLSAADATVVCVGMSRCHGHILAKFPPGDVRIPVGLAKKHAWFRLHEAGRNGRLWGKRCGVKTIADRAHQMNVYRYIIKHEQQEGAFVWAWHRNRDR